MAYMCHGRFASPVCLAADYGVVDLTVMLVDLLLERAAVIQVGHGCLYRVKHQTFQAVQFMHQYRIV